MNSRRGLAPLVVILAIAAVVAVGGWLYYRSKSNGVAVRQQTTTQTTIPGWRLYKNENYGMEFQYPDDYQVSSSIAENDYGTQTRPIIVTSTIFYIAKPDFYSFVSESEGPGKFYEKANYSSITIQPGACATANRQTEKISVNGIPALRADISKLAVGVSFSASPKYGWSACNAIFLNIGQNVPVEEQNRVRDVFEKFLSSFTLTKQATETFPAKPSIDNFYVATGTLVVEGKNLSRVEVVAIPNFSVIPPGGISEKFYDHWGEAVEVNENPDFEQIWKLFYNGYMDCSSTSAVFVRGFDLNGNTTTDIYWYPGGKSCRVFTNH